MAQDVSVSRHSGGYLTKPIERFARLPEYKGIIPWDYNETGPAQPSEHWKIFFMSITLIAPIRLLLIFLISALGAAPCFALGAYFPKGEPWPRNAVTNGLMGYLRFLARVVLLVAGFWHIGVSSQSQKNILKEGGKNARILVSNHVSIWDGFLLYHLTGCSVIVKQSLMMLPIINGLLQGLQCIGVERKTEGGRQRAKKTIMQHVEDSRYPPLLIFPQGTTTLSNVMTLWKGGAFAPGCAVQPVILYYRNEGNKIDFVEQTLLFNMYYTCCQFWNRIDVELLNVYDPNDEERQNALQFAGHVREQFVQRMKLGMSSDNLHVTRHSYEDYNMLYRAGRTKVAWEHVVIADILDAYGLHPGVPIKTFKTFLRAGGKDHGAWNQQDYEQFWGVTRVGAGAGVRGFLQRCVACVFEMSDANKNDVIEFEEFLVLLAVLLCERNKGLLVCLYYKCVGQDVEGFRELVRYVDQIARGQSDAQQREKLSELSAMLRKLDEVLETIVCGDDGNEANFARFYKVLRAEFTLLRGINEFVLENYCDIDNWKAIKTRCRLNL